MPYSILIQVEISQRNAGMAQSVERRIGSAEVTGPIPVASLKKAGAFASAFFYILLSSVYIKRRCNLGLLCLIA